MSQATIHRLLESFLDNVHSLTVNLYESFEATDCRIGILFRTQTGFAICCDNEPFIRVTVTEIKGIALIADGQINIYR